MFSSKREWIISLWYLNIPLRFSGKILAKADWLHWNFCCILWSATFLNLILHTFPKLMHRGNTGKQEEISFHKWSKMSLRVLGSQEWGGLKFGPPSYPPSIPHNLTNNWPHIPKNKLCDLTKSTYMKQASQYCNLGQNSDMSYSDFQTKQIMYRIHKLIVSRIFSSISSKACFCNFSLSAVSNEWSTFGTMEAIL